jgi:hemoglobin/transferrin/lactoferrin receptor protein
MKLMKLLYFCIIFSFLWGNSYAQNGELKGKVTDAESQTGLPNASISIPKINLKLTSDEEGIFSTGNIPAGKYSLIISYTGYKEKTLEVKIIPDSILTLNIELLTSPVSLGEILVTSTRYETRIRDVAIPMEVADKNEILKTPSVSASDILQTKSGISLKRDGIWATDVDIRGLSGQDIVTLVDGTRLETATDISARLSLVDITDIERIEVIKGGMSSLYGTGALGGIVNIITKQGYYNNKFTLSGSMLGSYNSVNDGGSVRLSLSGGSAKWYAKISGTIRKAGNTKTPDGVLNNSQYRDNNFSAVLSLKPIKNQEMKFDLQQYFAKDIGIPGGYPLFTNNALVTYPQEQRTMFSAQYDIKNISSFLLNLSAKFYVQNIYRNVENIPYLVQIVPSGSTTKRISVLDITPHAWHYTKGGEIQSEWMLFKTNHLTAGIDIWQRDLDSKRERDQKVEVLDSTGQVISTSLQTIGDRPIPVSYSRNIGFFAQDNIKLLNNKLSITLGGRIDQNKISNDLTYNPEYIITNGVRNNTPPGQTILWQPAQSTDISWSGNAGLLYALFKNVDVSFDAARSFRSPSLEERYQYIDLGNLVRLGNPYLKPEQGAFFDLGLRIWRPEVSFTGSIFYNQLRNLVIEVPGTYESRAAMIKTNAGNSRLYGFDLNLEYNFYKDFVFYATSSYVRGQDIENHVDLPQIPPLNGRIGLRTPVSTYLNIDITGVYFTRQDKIAAGEIQTPGYVYWNAAVNPFPLKLGRLSIKFYGGIENIFDKSYRNHLSTNRGYITSEPGRNYYLKANVLW